MSRLETIKSVCLLQQKKDKSTIEELVELVNDFLFSVDQFPIGYIRVWSPLNTKRISQDNPVLNAGLSNVADAIRFSFVFNLFAQNPKPELALNPLVDYAKDIGVDPFKIGVTGYVL